MFKNLMLRTKVTLIFILLNIIIFAIIVGIFSSIINAKVTESYDKLLLERTKNFSSNLQMILTEQIRNFLNKISEEDLQKIKSVYESYEAKKLNKEEFIDKVRKLLERSSIGKKGYSYVLDRSKFPEKLVAIIHPYFEGEDFINDGVMRRVGEKKTGFVEYSWKDGEGKERRMMAYFKYFEEMDWIIVTAVYATEIHSIINFSEAKNILEPQLKTIEGECFVIDYEGKALLHHTFFTGKDLSNYPFIKKMIGEKEGKIKYVEKEEWENKSKRKEAYFFDLPVYRLIVVGTIYEDYIKSGLRSVNNLIIIVIVVNLLLIWIFGRFGVGFLIRSLNDIKAKLYNIVSTSEKADLTKRIEVDSTDEIGQIANLVNLLFEKLNRDILKVKVSSELLESSSSETFEIMEGELKKDTQLIEQSMKDIHARVNNAASSLEELTVTVEEMSRNIDSIASSMERQAAAVEESASSIEEMVRNIENTAALSGKTKDISINLNNVSLEGSKAVKDSIVSVKEVAEYSQQILKLLGLISNIAKQTNLLAMNAAIEAAHAGEAGKGFAIVADEIRRLAEDTNKNARDIGEVVSSIVAKIDDSVRLSEKAGVGLDMITAYSKQNMDIISQLTIALQEQSNGAKEILKAIEELVKITEEVKVAMTEQKHATSDFSAALIGLRDISVGVVENINVHSESLSALVKGIEKIRVSVELSRKQIEELRTIVSNFIIKEEGPTALRLVE